MWVPGARQKLPSHAVDDGENECQMVLRSSENKPREAVSHRVLGPPPVEFRKPTVASLDKAEEKGARQAVCCQPLSGEGR